MFGNHGMRRGLDRFESHYQCFSTAFSGKVGIDDGDKVLLPASALDALARMNVDYPMLFRLENEEIGKKLHCGVLEFTADEGHCYLPFWMMENLLIEEGSLLKVTNVTLPKATFVKFRAQSVDFLDIQNPKVALEVTLRKFTCLTVGEIIRLDIAHKIYQLEVVELRPGDAASIIETDCITDFAEPVGYVEPQRVQNAGAGNGSDLSSGGSAVRVPQKAKAAAENEQNQFHAFAGQAKRIDGKEGSNSKLSESKDEKMAPAFPASAPVALSAGVFVGVGRSLAAAAAASGQSSSLSPQSTGGAQGVTARQSRIGDQFSKKKTSVSAFTGPAHKLA